ncbi:hypothetical protein QQY79_04165 [Flavobacterium tructae]|uniref:ABC-three component system protein n=1 Tax=Flavobacterium tructae TaxID=1114873 RepID=UPI002551FFF9|nr:ABC-three component system protein [Flavobacterium tructae]MDL2141704.1 hypothetical protein [Flavobacterium tructae]
MSTDATPSWSGYIFQGEVALCKAIETINTLGGTIPDSYALNLEQDEDFSLRTHELEVFQVKAYLSKDSDKTTKYKPVIRELIDKYYYTTTVTRDPNDGRKRIKTVSDDPQPDPINCSLITDKVIVDFEPDLTDFEDRYQKGKDILTTIQGQYTLDNINQKLFDAVKANRPELPDDDVWVKVSYCCLKISKLVKERHSKKTVLSVLFIDIQKWIDNSALAFSLDICWYEITKMFLKYLTDELRDYDHDIPAELAEYNKVNNITGQLEIMDQNDLKQLIEYYTTPHKSLNVVDLRQSYGNFLDEDTVKNVALKALKKINDTPVLKSFQYTKANAEGEQIRYQLLNHNNEFDDSRVQRVKFQKHCEEFYKYPNTLDVDVFVTRHITKNKEDVKLHLQDLLSPEQLEKDKDRLFGFSTIIDCITDINS